MELFAGDPEDAGYRDGTATAARFRSPAGLASDGRALYVADFDSQVIREIDVDNAHVTTLAGYVGEVGHRDGPLESARFHHPYALAVRDRSLFVTDMDNDCVRVIDLDRREVATVRVDAPPPMPTGIAILDRNLYVLSSARFAIARIDGDHAEYIAGDLDHAGYRDGAARDARFGGLPGPAGPEGLPGGLAVREGTLFVADASNDAIRALDARDGRVSTLAHSSPFAGAGRGSGDTLSGPTNMAVDGDWLHVSDRDGIARVDVASGHVRRSIACRGASGLALVPPWLYVVRAHAVFRVAHRELARR